MCREYLHTGEPFMSVLIDPILKNGVKDLEMAQQLRAFAAFTKDQHLVSSIHMVAHNCL